MLNWDEPERTPHTRCSMTRYKIITFYHCIVWLSKVSFGCHGSPMEHTSINSYIIHTLCWSDAGQAILECNSKQWQSVVGGVRRRVYNHFTKLSKIKMLSKRNLRVRWCMIIIYYLCAVAPLIINASNCSLLNLITNKDWKLQIKTP